MLTFRDPEGLVAEAVADPTKLGYGKLYILFLENSKLQIARAFRLLGEDSSFPMLIHCVHGCVQNMTAYCYDCLTLCNSAQRGLPRKVLPWYY
jgi:hypothetical protein